MSRARAIRLTHPPISFRIDLQAVAILLLLALATVSVLVVTIGVGEYTISPGDVLRSLLGSGEETQQFIIQSLRLPRALVAVMVGMGLAISGGIVQGVARNPLASPDIIGVTAGANLAAVAVILLFSSVPIVFLPVAAFGGALVAGAAVYLLAWSQGVGGARLVLVGIGVTAVAQALVMTLITQSRIIAVSRALTWMTGSVYGRNWDHVSFLAGWLLVVVPVVFVLVPHLHLLQFGEDTARSLGGRVAWHRTLLLVASVALAAAATAAAGPVSFVGLIAPHIAVRLVGSAPATALPTAGFVGGLIVLLADLFGRTLFAPIEIPCGVITALIGAPYFLYLLYRSQHV